MAGANPSVQKRLRELKMAEKREEKARRKAEREAERADAVARGEAPGIEIGAFEDQPHLDRLSPDSL